MNLPVWWKHSEPYAIMDCLEGMKELPDNCVDFCITSPPYNVGANNHNYSKKYTHISDNLEEKQYYQFINKALDEMLRITKHHVFFNIQMLSSNKVPILMTLGDRSDEIKDIIMWVKPNPPPTIEPGVLSSGIEWIIIFSHDNPRQRKFRIENFDSRWVRNYIIEPVSKGVKGHGATFPIKVPLYLIINFSKCGDVVLDPFLGSGTTLRACRETGRVGLGFEINPEYEEIIRKRALLDVPKLEAFDGPSGPPRSTSLYRTLEEGEKDV